MLIDELIQSVLADIEPLMTEAFAQVGGVPPPDSPLDQVNLLDGSVVVQDYLRHGEPGLAFDHLLYMIVEPPLTIDQTAYVKLVEAGSALGFRSERWAEVSVTP